MKVHESTLISRPKISTKPDNIRHLQNVYKTYIAVIAFTNKLSELMEKFTALFGQYFIPINSS